MRNLKALFCLVISIHLTLITNTSSLFVYCTISFGYRQPTFISHLLIGLSPFTFLEDGRLLSEKVKFFSGTTPENHVKLFDKIKKAGRPRLDACGKPETTCNFLIYKATMEMVLCLHSSTRLAKTTLKANEMAIISNQYLHRNEKSRINSTNIVREGVWQPVLGRLRKKPFLPFTSLYYRSYFSTH